MIKHAYEKGNFVVYGTTGICVIDDVTEMSFMAGMEKSRYYVLKPEHSSDSKVYVPAANEILMSKLRPLLTRQEIDMLLTGMRDKELEWETDRRLRTEKFHEILTNGVTESLLLMIRSIYLKKNELENMGRKLAASDMNTLKTAEKLVEEEFACVLGIEKKDVGAYIRSMIQAGRE